MTAGESCRYCVGVEALELLDQRRAFEVQQLRRLTLVALRALERALDQRQLDASKCTARSRGLRPGTTARRLPAPPAASESPATDPCASICPRPWLNASARSTAFSSCRTLPGQCMGHQPAHRFLRDRRGRASRVAPTASERSAARAAGCRRGDRAAAAAAPG